MKCWACPAPRTSAILAFGKHQPHPGIQSPQTLFFRPDLHQAYAPVLACLPMCGLEWGQWSGVTSPFPGPAWGYSLPCPPTCCRPSWTPTCQPIQGHLTIRPPPPLSTHTHTHTPTHTHTHPLPNTGPDSVGWEKKPWLGGLTDVSPNTGSSWCDPRHEASWQASGVEETGSHP